MRARDKFMLKVIESGDLLPRFPAPRTLRTLGTLGTLPTLLTTLNPSLNHDPPRSLVGPLPRGAVASWHPRVAARPSAAYRAVCEPRSALRPLPSTRPRLPEGGGICARSERRSFAMDARVAGVVLPSEGAAEWASSAAAEAEAEVE
jgi:hypothetical protein